MNEQAPDEAKIPLREKSVPEIASVLQATLGQSLTAFSIQESDPRQVGGFARGEVLPDPKAEATLRDLAEITEILLADESPETVRAIMVGMNPALNDHAIVELFHNGEAARVLAVASELMKD